MTEITILFTDRENAFSPGNYDIMEPFAVFKFEGTNSTAEAVLAALERAVSGWVEEHAEGAALATRFGSLGVFHVEPELSDPNSSLAPYLAREGIARSSRLLWVPSATCVDFHEPFWGGAEEDETAEPR